MPRKGPGERSQVSSSGQSGGREVYFEFVPIGEAMRVTAVDGETGIEVVIQGPVRAARSELERIALNKLLYVMRQGKGAGSGAPSVKKQPTARPEGAERFEPEEGEAERSQTNGGKGWIV